MKPLKILGIFLVMVTVGLSYDKKVGDESYAYEFINAYCARVTVGGVVGVSEKCFKIGDQVKGKVAVDGVVMVRIAGHSSVNDGPPSPNSYQEFLGVPAENLKVVGN